MVKKATVKTETSSAIPSTSPKYKAFTVAKFAVGDWRVVSYDIQDDKILSKSTGDGGDKALCLERFKMIVAKEFFLGK